MILPDPTEAYVPVPRKPNPPTSVTEAAISLIPPIAIAAERIGVWTPRYQVSMV